MATKSPLNLIHRPRRNRKSPAMRRLVRETILTPQNFVYPVFIIDGKNKKESISSMPGISRMSIDLIVKEAHELVKLGIPGIAIFPNISKNKKDQTATESTNPKGLLQRCVREIKSAVDDLVVITDVAMDPYSTDGHDGLVKKGIIDNDATLEILADMAVSQAKAGTDMVAPSDMMDGRVGFIRTALDQSGFTDVGILAYSAKYCSSFYGPFREALDSAPKVGDKKTYQMDYANQKEAIKEVMLDIDEGADIVMVKPALAYLDVISRIKDCVDVPVAAYNVSGEYSMIKAAAQKGWIDEKEGMIEILTSIKRAGADIIFSYFAKDFAKLTQ
ncbi:MAG: porphobilinogen synthase [Candidatus Omnitrophica bacterium]|nr:porphobilinogen synthase [Candidatus Omnitrophota bacterium]